MISFIERPRATDSARGLSCFVLRLARPCDGVKAIFYSAYAGCKNIVQGTDWILPSLLKMEAGRPLRFAPCFHPAWMLFFGSKR